MDKLNRWVSQYFIHIGRLIKENPDGTVNEELGRRFICEVIEGRELEELHLVDLSKASQDSIKSLVGIFEAWVLKVAGTTDFYFHQNPRLSDFLVIDEGALRSLVALPDKVLPAELLPRAERRVSFSSLGFSPRGGG